MQNQEGGPLSDPQVPLGVVSDYFPLDAGPVEDGTFEIGLVLGGTVSAGAYTAGVLDFLVEALDAWEARKKDKRAYRQRQEAVPEELRDVPEHRVVLRVVTGTSGGGINAVLLARALNYNFPPVSANSTPEQRTHNVFYRTWVSDLDIRALLATEDLEHHPEGPVLSLLNGEALEHIARTALHFTGSGPAPARPWVVRDLPLVLTYSNVEGVPYQALFRGNAPGRSEFLVTHADYIRFLVHYPGAVSSTPAPAKWEQARPSDGWEVAPPNGRQDWDWLVDYALGTGAFPFGFPPRRIARPADHYRFRYVTSLVNGQQQAGWLDPVWAKLLPADTAPAAYSFTAMDGGCADNEPLGLAHDILGGLTHQNPREAGVANRALILVDPFSSVPDQPAAHPRWTLGKLFLNLESLLLDQSRYSTADMSLFLDDTVYSRFLITAKRTSATGTQLGNDALAGSGLEAFLGFLAESYREHDFLLGRRNAQQFLRTVLQLDASNPAFGAAAVSYRGTPRCLVPLYGTADIEQPLPGWPAGKADIDGLRTPLRRRVAGVLEQEGLRRVRPGLRRPLRPLVSGLCTVAGWWAAGRLVNRLQRATREHHLA